MTRIMAHVLEQDPDFKVFRRLQPMRRRRSGGNREGERTLCVLDLVTTGPDVRRDRILRLTLQRANVDACGRIVETHEARSWFEDPGFELAPEQVQATGITQLDVAGRTISDGEAFGLIASADMLVSHGASNHRPFVDRRLCLPATRWTCTLDDVDWHAHGFARSDLRGLLSGCGWFLDGDAGGDRTNVILNLLELGLPDGRSVLQALSEPEDASALMVEAGSVPIGATSLLRERGYRRPSGRRTWIRSISAACVEDERAWLMRRVYGGTRHLVAVRAEQA
ncbi:hypothetical protein [Sphingomonas sp. S2-65]|uniref:hypothetical protein n=1 Tax=Sphingomonas sp. S2-65 TaxID=2903960 RepID=UPI001F232A48|nr:hypothetical protein [Sphingomonas sp. S2-65]UYY58013.1 hypothetical protein LZ586_15315 [Sphingomonas sp. S2-65]